ncbi:MAG TPA: hypothetical protein VNM24_16140 [Burkholderiales bacterium]|nr:hypothetical protein [Burkholderiales bacterium]
MNASVSSILGAVLGGLLVHQGPASGQGEWYEGKASGFWGLSPDSQVFEGAISKFGLSAFGGRVEEPAIEKHYSGYRFTDLFTIEGSKTSLSLPPGACGYDSLSSDLDAPCHGAAWSLTGVATLQEGLSLYGRLGLQYWEKQRGADLPLLRNGQQDLGTMYGVGMSYQFRKDWYLHYDLERYSDVAPGLGLRPGRELGLSTRIHSIGLSIRF